MASGYPTNSLPVFTFSLVAAIIVTAISFVVSKRRQRASLKSNPSKESEASEIDLHVILPPFWTIPRVLSMILGLALMVFGFDYFWTIPGTPPADFLAGLGCVIGGVLLVVIPFDIALLARAKAIRKARDSTRQT